MIQVTDPIITAMIQNAPDLTRSIKDPETIDATVQEKRRNAPQNTPVMWSWRLTPILGAHGKYWLAPVTPSRMRPLP